MSENKKEQFGVVFNKLLSLKLEKLIISHNTENGGFKLNPQSCNEIYVTIFDTLTNLFEQNPVPLDNECVNYIAQKYYDSIRINDNATTLIPDIFDKRAKLENIDTKKLAFIAMLLNGTTIADDVVAEVKRRS